MRSFFRVLISAFLLVLCLGCYPEKTKTTAVPSVKSQLDKANAAVDAANAAAAHADRLSAEADGVEAEEEPEDDEDH